MVDNELTLLAFFNIFFLKGFFRNLQAAGSGFCFRRGYIYHQHFAAGAALGAVNRLGYLGANWLQNGIQLIGRSLFDILGKIIIFLHFPFGFGGNKVFVCDQNSCYKAVK